MEPCSKIDDHLTEDEISKLKVVIGAYSEMLTTDLNNGKAQQLIIGQDPKHFHNQY